MGVSKTYAEFVEYMGMNYTANRGSESGNTNVTINELKTKTKIDLQTPSLWGNEETVRSAEVLEVELEGYLTLPEVPDFSGATDLSNRDDLNGFIDSVMLSRL